MKTKIYSDYKNISARKVVVIFKVVDIPPSLSLSLPTSLLPTLPPSFPLPPSLCLSLSLTLSLPPYLSLARTLFISLSPPILDPTFDVKEASEDASISLSSEGVCSRFWRLVR